MKKSLNFASSVHFHAWNVEAVHAYSCCILVSFFWLMSFPSRKGRHWKMRDCLEAEAAAALCQSPSPLFSLYFRLHTQTNFQSLSLLSSSQTCLFFCSTSIPTGAVPLKYHCESRGKSRLRCANRVCLAAMRISV